MKNILFIGSELFFGTSVGGFRQDRWLKACLDQGKRCTVVDYYSLVPRFYSPIDTSDYFSFRKKIKSKVQKKPSVKEGRLVSILRFIKHFFILEVFNPLIWFKILYIIFTLRNKHFDIVFTSSPPFTSNVIGLVLKKTGKAKVFLVDFRDEWGDSLFLPKSTIINRKIIERIVVNNADSIITVSEYSKRNLQNLYKLSSISCIYNAPDINYKIFKNNLDISPSTRITILFTGSLAPGLFDSNKLLEFIACSSKFMGEKVTFKFLGTKLNFNNISLENVQFIDQQSLDVSRKMQLESDILLFVAANFPDNGGIVSSKIFEYLQSGKPILPLFVQRDSDVYNIIKNSCGFCPIINYWSDLDNLIYLKNDKIEFNNLPFLVNEDFLQSLLDAYPNYIKNHLDD